VIRIHKPKTPPAKLATDGKRKRDEHCKAYLDNPNAYEANKEKFDFASSIYAHESVKKALIQAQHQKCCFCEDIVGNHGDVEHFRPKAAYQQAKSEPLKYPAYYWLAYDWDNLYLACPACNQRHKKNLFPLQSPQKRASNHRQRISKELSMFIDCGKENPEEFIGFRAEIAYAIDGNQRGQITIDYLGLNTSDRTEKRLQILQKLNTLNKVLISAKQYPNDKTWQKLAKEAKDILEKSTLDNAIYSAAARSAISSGFQDLIG
jgi:uncharacterized protein (TIGR02646 family)